MRREAASPPIHIGCTPRVHAMPCNAVPHQTSTCTLLEQLLLQRPGTQLDPCRYYSSAAEGTKHINVSTSADKHPAPSEHVLSHVEKHGAFRLGRTSVLGMPVEHGHDQSSDPRASRPHLHHCRPACSLLPCALTPRREAAVSGTNELQACRQIVWIQLLLG